MTTPIPTPLLPFVDLQQFSVEIETLVSEHKLNYIDAVIAFAEKRGLEVEVLGEMIQKRLPLMSKIQRCAEELKFLKPIIRLPI